jgi:hypothetical protein
VVGIPDEMTGESIVAVLQQSSGTTARYEDLRSSITRALGSLYTPSVILDLMRDLGSAQFPATVSGKPQKGLLRQWVLDHLKDKKKSQGHTADGTLESQLIGIWASVSGRTAADISTESSVHTFADSMMLIRVRSIISDRFQKDITVRELTEHRTIHSQSELLRQRGEIGMTEKRSQVKGQARETWQHQAQNQARLSRLERSSSPHLAAKGLTWAEVEDVFPKPNIIGSMEKSARPNSWNHRHSMVVRTSDEGQVMAALQTWLEKHPLMRSMTASDEVGEVFLILPAHETWLRQQLFNAGGIERAEDLLVYRLGEPDWDCVSQPGPYLKVTVLPIQHTPDVGLIFHWHHAIFDGLIIKQWYRELEQLLGKQERSTKFSSFERYANAVHDRSQNTAAQHGVDYFVDNLRSVSTTCSALWPPQRAPLWLLGNDQGWQYPNGRPGEPDARVPLDGTQAIGTIGVEYTIAVPHILELREQHEITPPVVAKGACVLLNLYLTGGDDVLLVTNESGRSWPFVGETEAGDKVDGKGDTGDDVDPLSIDGPTFKLVVSRNSVAKGETVVQFLGRLRREQHDLEKHSHTPLDRILEQLEEPSASSSTSQSQADGLIVRNALDRQIFDWVPDLQPTQGKDSAALEAHQNQPSLEMLEVLSRTDQGFIWFPSMVSGTETMKLKTTWDDAQLHATEASKATKQFLRAARWLSQPENWHRPAKECDFEAEDVAIGDCGLADCYRR